MKKALLTAALFSVCAAATEAQVKDRWRLQWSNEKPQVYTYRSADDQLENFWFFTFTLENKTDQIVPLIFDVLLYTETGKDLQHDSLKVDPATIKDNADFRKPHQYNDGISVVIVNGVVAMNDGSPTGKLAGKALRKTADR